MDDIKPRQTRDIRRQRSQFQSSYYYAPNRPTRTAPVQTQTTSISQQGFLKPQQPLPRQQPITQTRPAAAPQAARPVAPTVVRPLQSPQQYRQASEGRPTSPKKSSGLIPALAMMSIILVSAFVGAKLFIKHDSDEITTQPQARTEQKQASKASPAAVEPIQQPAVAKSTTDEMTAAINSVVDANKSMNIGVAVVDLKSSQTYKYGLDLPFDAASTGKLITASYYLNQVEAGKLTLDKKVADKSASEQLSNMIEKSDNAAWFALNEILKHDNLDSYGKSIGFTSYNADKNVITPADLSILLTKLYTNKLLNETDKNLLLDHMKNANKTDFILSALPGGLKIYHKAGWLDDRSHDSAIVDNGTDPYVLVVYVKGGNGGATQQRMDIIHKITNATVAHFIGTEAAAKVVSE